MKGLKLSARNQFKGKVVAVEKGVITAKVKIEIKVPVVITAVITKEAVEDLGLKVGDEVEAIVKSTEVIIAKVAMATLPRIGKRCARLQWSFFLLFSVCRLVWRLWL